MRRRKEIKASLVNNELNSYDELKKAIIIFIEEKRNEYPQSLTVSDVSEITNYSENSIYVLLKQGKIPFAKKLKGWRIPRDSFLLWWYGYFFDEQTAKTV